MNKNININHNQRILIFGNSGSGKSTLAKSFVAKYGFPHLDLDSLAWLNTTPPSRKPIEESAVLIKNFTHSNPNWIIEGCYSDLIELVLGDTAQMIFLNPGIETCVENCKSRPWEPHKYDTPEQQQKNLNMLLDWVRDYSTRKDEFSLSSHKALFERFDGKKIEYDHIQQY